jgi:PAS domain S-box-containing protein
MSNRKSEDRTGFSLEHLMAGLGPAVLKSIRAPFSIISSDFRVLWINKAMAYIHGYEEEEITLGKVCYETLNKRSEPCLDCPVQAVLATHRTRVMEQWAVLPSGEKRWGEVRAYPVRNDNRQIVAVIVMVMDITSRVESIQHHKEYTAYLSERLSEAIDPDREIQLADGAVSIQVELSKRETEILRLVTEGYTNHQISELLTISANTVKTHVNNIFNKLGVNDRTQAAVLATRHRLV